jgi:hypothetical protein
MAKYKIQFTKDRKGQAYFERSLTLEALQLLLILSDEVSAKKDHRNSGYVLFVFHKKALNTYAKAVRLPLSVMAKLVAPAEWKP